MTIDVPYLRGLMGEASSGPWSTDADDRFCPLSLVLAGGTVIADLESCEGPSAANCRLIAAMHSALPYLLDRVEALEKAAARVTWYDVSGNDDDFVRDVEALRALLPSLTPRNGNQP